MQNNSQQQSFPSQVNLPEECFLVAPNLPVEHALARVRLGKSGFEIIPQPSPCLSLAELNLLVDRMNREMGVSRLQAYCMSVGAQWGWESPGANPSTYLLAASDMAPADPNPNRPFH